jgi:flagellar motor protein MotB
VAPNRTPDGRDDPEGRQKNRRVEIVVEKRA